MARFKLLKETIIDLIFYFGCVLSMFYFLNFEHDIKMSVLSALVLIIGIFAKQVGIRASAKTKSKRP